MSTAQEGDVAKLQCEVTSHIFPKVIWYRDLKNQIQVQRDANVAFVITPHSTVCLYFNRQIDQADPILIAIVKSKD